MSGDYGFRGGVVSGSAGRFDSDLTVLGTGSVSGDLVVSGDLTINGSTTTINTSTISVDDINIELGATASPTNLTADGGGMTLKGTTDKTLNWVSANTAWTSSENMDLASGKNYMINGSQIDTDDVLEGSNQFHTTARARAAISATDNSEAGRGALSYNSTSGVLTYEGISQAESRKDISVTDAGGDGSLSYASGSGVITYTGPSAAETRAHFSVTESDGDALSSLSYSNGVFTFDGLGADEIRQQVSVTDAGGDGSLSYASGSGVITYTGPSAAETQAHFSVTDNSSAGRGALSYAAGVFTYEGISQAESRKDISVTDAGGDGSLSYASGSGVITYTGPSAAETRAHFSAANSDGDALSSLSYSAGVFTFDGLGADEIRQQVSVTDAGGDGSLSYASGSGVITYTGPSAAETRAHFSVTDNSAAGRGALSYSNGVFTYEGISQAESRKDISVTDAGGDGSLSYASGSGVITYTGPSAAETRAHFSAGDGLAVSAGDFSVNVDDSSIETNADSLRIKALGVTNAMLSGSIANAKLSNSSTTFGTTEVSLGSSSTVIHGLTGIKLTQTSALALDTDADTLIRAAGDDDMRLEVGSASTGLQLTSAALMPLTAGMNLGSSAQHFANIYTGDFHLKNERGDWTIFEESDHLRIRNNLTGQTFKMGMTLINE